MNAELTLLYGALAGYSLAALLSLVRRIRGAHGRGIPTLVFSAVAILLHAAFVAVRTARVGFLPFASRFESMALFALAIETAALALYLRQASDSAKALTGLFSSGLLAVAIFAFGWIPGGGLNPILDSAWFAVHILVAFGAYGLVVAGLGWSMAALVDRRLSDFGVPRRIALLAACLLGAGILTGALWADVSWGTYWNWDPKESWALLTWTVLVAYSHLRARRWLNMAGFGLAFAVMMFTFVGINLLKWGAHRY